MSESKQKICDLLLPTLQATKNLQDLGALEYRPEKDIVVAVFKSGYKKIANVAMDSGTAMILDIVKQIV